MEKVFISLRLTFIMPLKRQTSTARAARKPKGTGKKLQKKQLEKQE